MPHRSHFKYEWNFLVLSSALTDAADKKTETMRAPLASLDLSLTVVRPSTHQRNDTRCIENSQLLSGQLGITITRRSPAHWPAYRPGPITRPGSMRLLRSCPPVAPPRALYATLGAPLVRWWIFQFDNNAALRKLVLPLNDNIYYLLLKSRASRCIKAFCKKLNYLKFPRDPCRSMFLGCTRIGNVL